MGVNGKKKGGKGEREACSMLKEWTGLDFRRVPQSGGLRGHIMDYTVGDIICTDSTMRHKIFPFSIEVKNYKLIDFSTLLKRPGPRKNKAVECIIDTWWEQTLRDSERGEKLPMLMMRFDNLPKAFFFIVMDRETAKNLTIPRERMVTRKYVIFTSLELSNIKWPKFYKSAMKLWKTLHG